MSPPSRRGAPRWPLALALLLGCQGAPAAPASPATPAAAADAPAEGAPPDPSQPLVAAMLRKVVAHRKLPARGPVRSVTLDRGALLAHVREQSEGDIPRTVIQAQGTLLQAIGWVPPGYDQEQGTHDLLESQLAGLYDPGPKTMFLARDLGPADAEATLAHELVHALQDQHYDLGPRLKYRPDAGDEPSAIQALAEGDATSAMIDVMLSGTGKDALSLPEKQLVAIMEAQTMASAEGVPPLLKASLIAPYVDGLRFVNALRRRGGWAEVDRVWRSPPTTTEQLLHLDKYDLREPPVPVPAPPVGALGGGFRVVFADLLGEQGLRIALQEHASHREASQGAAGWGGDRVALMSRSRGGREEWFVTWWIRFDGARVRCPEATEAFELLQRGFLPQAISPGGTRLCTERPEMGPLAAGLSGCDILLAAGPFYQHEGKWRPAGGCGEVGSWVTDELKRAP